MYDLILRKGKIIDGTGNCWFAGDVGILNGRISKIGQIEEGAKKILDVNDLVVCPGFIDIHSHSDITVLLNPRSESKIMQGVTTEVIGNCGFSPSPVNPKTFEGLRQHFVSPELRWIWPTFNDFLNEHENHPSSVNIVPLVGHGTLRIAVMGLENRAPRPEELCRMKALLQESLDTGAFGLSTGLIYAPACYSATEEIIELAKMLRKGNRLYATHIRGESKNLINAVHEALNIGREASVRVQLSHHKASGVKNWGKVSESLKLVEKARTDGIDVTCDVYPYPASGTDLTICLPPWVREDSTEKMLERINDKRLQRRIRSEIESDEMQGAWSSTVRSTGWDRMVISKVHLEENKGLEGLSLAEIARDRNADVFEVFFDLLTREKGNLACIFFEMCEKDVRTVLSFPVTMIGSDGRSLSPSGILSEGKPHPRNYGTFPRVLARYVREEHLLTLEEAIRKMTFLPAQKLGLRDRGIVREGFWADIVVFSPTEVLDMATFEEPAKFPKGIEYVLVNGKLVVSEGRHTGAVPGMLLRAA